MDKHITVPMKKETVATLKAGDYVYLTGTVYTARDAAHKRMYEILQESWDSIDDRIYARLRAARMRNAVARQHQPIRQITVIVANVHVPPTAVA